MDFEKMHTMIELSKHSLNPKEFDFIVMLFNFFIALIFLVLYYDIKIKDIIKERRFMLLLGIVLIVDFFLEITFGNILLLTPVISFFIVQITFMLKDKELFNVFNSFLKKNPDENQMEFEDERAELEFKMTKLGKNNNFNLIDILYLYDYITDYQRRKVIQDLIYDDTDGMIEYLNTNPAVSDEELREAKAILNLINLQGKVLTKEEALLHIVDIANHSNIKNDDNNEKT